MRLFIEARSHTMSSREPTSGDEWDRGDTSTDWDIPGGVFYRENPDEQNWNIRRFDIEDDKFKEGDMVHIVYVIYSTGDSFGYDDGMCVEFLKAYPTREEAHALVRLVESYGRDDSLRPQLITELFGSERDVSYLPWEGYFERLDYASVVSGTIV